MLQSLTRRLFHPPPKPLVVDEVSDQDWSRVGSPSVDRKITGLVSYDTSEIDPSRVDGNWHRADRRILCRPDTCAKLNQGLSHSKFAWNFVLGDPKEQTYSYQPLGGRGAVKRDLPHWVQTGELPVEPAEGIITYYQDHSPEIRPYTSEEPRKDSPGKHHFMTAWMLAHRIGHVLKDKFDGLRSVHIPVNRSEFNILDLHMVDILNQVRYEYGLTILKFKPPKNLRNATIDFKAEGDSRYYPGLHFAHTELNLSLLRLSTSMNSSRDHVTTNWEELRHELVAQYLMTGRVQLVVPPVKVDLADATSPFFRDTNFGGPMSGTLRGRGLLEQSRLDDIARGLEHAIDRQLEACVGKVIYSYN